MLILSDLESFFPNEILIETAADSEDCFCHGFFYVQQKKTGMSRCGGKRFSNH